MRPRKVEPIGLREAFGFASMADGSRYAGPLPWNVYPPSRGPELRERRVAAGVGLRDFARRVGLRASEVSGLEVGSLDLPPEGWDAAFAALKGEE